LFFFLKIGDGEGAQMKEHFVAWRKWNNKPGQTSSQQAMRKESLLLNETTMPRQ
jgi:hypothetical protein